MSAERGRELVQFPFVYLIDEQRWIPNEASFLRPPEKPRIRCWPSKVSDGAASSEELPE